MMKRLIVITLIAAVTLYAETVAEDTPMNEINQLLQTLTAQHPWPPNDAVMEEVFLKSAEFGQLEKLCKTHWSSVLNHLDAAIGEDIGKIMLFATFQELDADNYMTALERLAEKFTQGKISKQIMLAALHPFGRMRAFFVDNFRHPRVRELLNDLKPHFKGDSKFQTWVTEILSGEAKADWDEYRDAHKGFEEGNIPRVFLNETSMVSKVTPNPVQTPTGVEKTQPNSVPVTDNQSLTESAETQSVPWKIPLLVGIITIVGAIMAWRFFRKKG